MSFPRYPTYRDSGVEWLGEVPAHWAIHKLRHIAALSGGGTPSRENPSYWNGNIPWVSPKDMKAERIFGAEECITEEGLQAIASELLPQGRVLMVVRSGILKHTIPVAINETAVALNQDMKAFRFDENTCVNKFFVRWVQGFNDPLLLAWAKQGATVESIEQSFLVETTIPLPDVAEQCVIIRFLDRETAKIDTLVAEQQRLVELLREKRQAVISHAVTKGLNPDAPMKPSGIEWLGDVPETWNVTRVKHLVRSIEQGWSPQCEAFPVESEDEWGVLKVGCVNGGTFNPSENKRLPEGLEPIPELTLAVGDLLISRANTRELVGSAAVVRGNHPKLMLCDKLYRLRVDDSAGHPRFLCSYLGTSAARGQIELEATGASASMVNIGQSTIMELAVTVPPAAEQIEIINSLDCETTKLDALVSEAERAIALLQERRTALISAAVTGKIDVRGLVGAEAA